jgi:hypothetical protein
MGIDCTCATCRELAKWSDFLPEDKITKENVCLDDKYELEDIYPFPTPFDMAKDAIGNGKYDMVNKPAHYTDGRKYEPVDVIIDWELPFDLSNAIRYISRCGRKYDAVEDIEKAVWYLNYWLKRNK